MQTLKYIVVSLLVISSIVLHQHTYSQFSKLGIKAWKGMASYYHPKFNGRRTSNGERFSNDKLTCANNFLKLGSYIRVKNIRNGKEVIVKVNDRMHNLNKRLIDLSQAAAAKLGLLKQGIGEVSIEVIDEADKGNLAFEK
jgi:rare lipoprotein A